MGVIGKLQNAECFIYIFTGKVENDTSIVFNKTLYHSCYIELRNHFSSILINTKHKNVHGLLLCINVDSYVVHIFYAFLFGHNKAVPISINKNKCFISLNTHTTTLAWVSGNSNKN